MPAAARGDIDATVKRIQNATAAGDYQAAAEGGVHAYRVLIEALDPNRLSVPAQVDWLDYAGFRFQVLLHATGVEWKEVGKAAAVAQHKWNELKPRVRDGRLRDAVDAAVSGMVTAAHDRDRTWPCLPPEWT